MSVVGTLRLRGLVRVVGWTGFTALVRLRCYRVLARLIARTVRQQGVDGRLSRPRPAGRDQPTVLVLSYEEFRGDIDAIAASGQVRVLVLSRRWIARLLWRFYPSDVDLGGDLRRCYLPEKSDPLWRAKQKYRQFLKRFLVEFYRPLKVDVVLTHHFRHVPDADWAAVTDELGIPHVLLNRENMIATKRQVDWVSWKVSRVGRFEGTAISVHNSRIRDLFVDQKYASACAIKVLGSPRMDAFASRIELGEFEDRGKRSLTLFGFLPKWTFDPSDIEPIFVDVHRVLVELAEEAEDIEVFVKHRPNNFIAWQNAMNELCPELFAKLAKLPNVTITKDLVAHDLIALSRVTLGLNSTTILESKLAGRAVVVPIYGGLSQEKYRERIYFKEDLDSFIVPSDYDDMKRILRDELSVPRSAKDVPPGIRDLFGRYVCSLEQPSTQAHVELFRSLAADAVSRTVEPSVH